MRSNPIHSPIMCSHAARVHRHAHYGIGRFGCLLLVILFLINPLRVNAGEKGERERGKNSGRNREVLNGSVMVHIRTIKASKPFHGEIHEASAAGDMPELEVDGRLADLKSKFETLHFRNFKLLSNEEISIPLKKKENITLTEKTVLTLRPLYLDQDRVGMWIKWTDKSGEQVLLDTRMHLNSEESMLTGTDSKGDCGLILAISARPNHAVPGLATVAAVTGVSE